MKKTILALTVILALLLSVSCSKPNNPGSAAASTSNSTSSAEAAETVEKSLPYGEYDDLSKNVPLKLNLAFGNRSRTITYNQSTPLELSNGEVITAGMIKPLWQEVAKATNSTFTDAAIQDAKASDMIKTESTNGFASANIFGGNSIATNLMNYGVQGKFVDLSVLVDNGYMPNFAAFLEENPSIRASITSYDGGIYYIPYIAEIGNAARQYNLRENWVVNLLDEVDAAYDTATTLDTFYTAYYTGDNARVGENGGKVTPKEGVVIEKKTADSIIEIQNNLPVKNGETLTKALIDYIERNYDYEKPSRLYLGEKAAYDIDELVALMRCVKTNPSYLTEGKATEVWPFFTRQSSYREDILRFTTYFGGTRLHGGDSYNLRWEFNEDGSISYTYSQEDTYEALVKFGQMNAEGLFYRDCFDVSRKGNIRTVLLGTDNSENPAYGFMTYDWIQSTTADNLNDDVVVVLPPVAEVNGVWQYYNDNTRTIKPDGWAISVAGSTDEQIKRAATVMDWFFSEDGMLQYNYGLAADVDTENLYQGPFGTEWPAFKSWTIENAQKSTNGDISTFLRDWVGCHMAIGYPKQIGFEYQSTSERGFDGWDLLLGSTIHYPNYEGDGLEGDNPNYYKLVPSAFSLTERQQEILNSSSSLGGDDEVEYIFNIIRYNSTGNVPSGVTLPKNYDEYYAYFQSKGVESYESTFCTAYMNMQMTE